MKKLKLNFLFWLFFICGFSPSTQHNRWYRRFWHTNCGYSGDQCFNSPQCCNGHVCASYDEDLMTEIPGKCVREKDLQLCLTDSDCKNEMECGSLGNSLSRYCFASRRNLILAAIDPEDDERVVGKGVFNSPCTISTDCNENLCCKEVAMGRNGVKTVCDHKHGLGKCL